MKTLLMMIAALTFLSFSADAQFNGIKNSVKNGADKVKIGKDKNKDKEKDNKNENDVENTEVGTDVGTNESSTNESTPNSSTTSSATLDNGKGYFYTSFKSKSFQNDVNVGDDLYVRMNMGKTMIEFADAAGFSSSHSAYGFVTVYIDNKKVFVSKPITFMSNISKKWNYIDIPINVNPDFIQKLSEDQSMLETNQDVWVFQQLFQEKSIPVMYTTAAIQNMTIGKHEVKVEFGLGESDSTEPKITVATGVVSVNVDAAGMDKLYQNGPKYLRPLSDAEKGKLIFNTNSFTPGNGELSVKLELPQPAKYYNEKWCQATTCDYDHGSMLFYVSVNGIPVTHWAADLWEADYESLKEFNFTVLPTTDAGYGDMGAPYNLNKIYKGSSPIVYALLDMLYGGIIKPGNHKLTIKAYSQESIPMNSGFELEHSIISKYPSIAETTIDFNVTADGLNKLINGSSAKKLSHAGGEWTAIDNKLKTANTGNPDMQILDVACKTEWKVVTNSAGVILYRECKADVLYKSEYGHRIEKHVGVKADYSGGGTYGSPYFSDRISADHGPSLLGTMHLPVPESKVK